jgi:cytochrome c oxidase assembly factor 4
MSGANGFTPPVIAGLHAGSKSDFGSDVDIDDMIEKMGCSKDYYKLEDCLGEHDRDWTKCQAEVKMLKQCNDQLNKLKQTQRAAAAAAKEKSSA